jgi:hypothetical protein
MAQELWVLGNTSACPMASSSERAIISLVSTNNDIPIKEWSVWFDGLISSGAPVRVTLSRCTTIGNMTTATVFSQCIRSGSTGAVGRSVGRVVDMTNTSSEPGSSGYLARRFVHPQVGYHEKFPMGQEPHIINGQAVCIFVSSPTTLDCFAEIVFEE